VNVNFLYHIEDKLLGRDLKVVLRLFFGIIFKGSFLERQKFPEALLVGDKLRDKTNYGLYFK
jgi:hypothetical protein